MARASYIAQAARRTADGVPTLMPPPALLVRWQMAAPPLELELPRAPGDRPKSAPPSSDRPDPIGARSTASGLQGAPPIAAHAGQMIAPAGSITPRLASPQQPAPSSKRTAPAPAAPGTRIETPTSLASATPIVQSVEPRTAARPAKQSVDLQSQMPATDYAPIARTIARIERAAAPSALAGVRHAGGDVTGSHAAPMPIVIAPSRAAAATPRQPPPLRAVLTPPAPHERAPVAPPPATASQSQAAPIIRIGSVEVQIVPAAAPPAAVTRPAAAAGRRSSLSRDLISMYGLRQG
jgi:hypothetical protein